MQYVRRGIILVRNSVAKDESLGKLQRNLHYGRGVCLEVVGLGMRKLPIETKRFIDTLIDTYQPPRWLN
jgi:hypothetical protein